MESEVSSETRHVDVAVPSGEATSDVLSKQESHDETKVDASEVASETKARRNAAHAISLAGAFVVATCLILGSCSISAIVNDEKELSKTLGSQLIPVTAIIVRGVITVAAILFGYEAMRAAERLLLPRRLFSDPKGAEIIQALTGMRAPSKFVAKQVRDVLGEFGAIVKTLTEAIASVRAPRDKDGP